MQLPVIALWVVCAALLDGINVPSGKPVVSLRTEAESPGLSFLSWDTEGGKRASRNLLYEPVSLWLQVGGEWVSGAQLDTETLESSETRATYRINLEGGGAVDWHIRQEAGVIVFRFVLDNVTELEAMLSEIKRTFKP